MTKDNSPLALIADDLPKVITHYKRELIHRFGISTVSATTLEQLYEVFDELFSEIDVIILDGCIPGNELNTIDFIRRAREKGFTKPILAASSSPEYRAMMLEAGCDGQSDKFNAPEAAWLLATYA